jgi:hypothetical protein
MNPFRPLSWKALHPCRDGRNGSRACSTAHARLGDDELRVPTRLASPIQTSSSRRPSVVRFHRRRPRTAPRPAARAARMRSARPDTRKRPLSSPPWTVRSD